MKGYFRAPEDTAQALTSDGWLRTGDVVRARGDGAFEFVGRLKDMFTVGGFNVYPAEVERALSEHPAIAESCVVGVPDARREQVPFAFVRLHPGATLLPEEIVAFCRERMANYKAPRHVEWVDEMPTTSTGKIDRRALRERAIKTQGGAAPSATQH